MTKQEILAMTGLTEDEFYAQYPTEESFKQGGWIQKATASIKKRGTEGVCTGSNFGGPSCRPGTKRYALAKTFRKMAKARKKEDGGIVEMYEEGENTNLGLNTPPVLNIPREWKTGKTDKTNSNIPLNFMGQPFATGAAEESISPLDFIGGVRGIVGLTKGALKYAKAIKPKYIKNINIGSHPKSIARAKKEMHKGVRDIVLPSGFENGGMVEMYEDGGDTESLKKKLFEKYYGQVTSDAEGRGYDYFYYDEPEFQKLPKKERADLIKRLSSYMEVPANPYTTASFSDYNNIFRTTEDIDSMLTEPGSKLRKDRQLRPVMPFGYNMSESNFGKGGVVDVYQLMGMPTPSMYEMGGDVMIEDYARGGMIKRKDGSYSKRGLWDNIRANKGSGKKPTKEMLKQERKIRAAEKKEYGGMVGMYNNGGPTKGYLNVSQSSYPFPDEVISNNSDYRDIEYSRVASGDISLGGGVRLGRQGKAYMVGSLGAQKGKKREITEADDKSYRIGDWEDVTTPTGKLGVEFLPFNSRSNKKKKGFTAAESSGEAGISYVNDKLAPYFRVSPEVGYRFGAKKNAPGYVSAGIDMGFRPRSADTYMAPGSNAEIIRAAGPNEVFTGANYLTPRVGGEYTFRNVGITPYAKAGYNLLTRNPNLEIGIKKGFAYGGSVPGEYSHVFSPKNHSNMGYAMGGAINYPEGLQMPIFAMGGMTSQPTIINVEKGELLVDPKTGKILTEYKGGGMVAHPEYGQDERGNVPVETNDQDPKFVITVAEAKNYKAADKNRDFLRMKSIMQKIAFNKERKEAKDAMQAERKAARLMRRQGTPRFGYGGTIYKYDGGAGIFSNPAPTNWNWGSGYTDYDGTPYANTSGPPYANNPMGVTIPGLTGTFTSPGSNMFSLEGLDEDFRAPSRPSTPTFNDEPQYQYWNPNGYKTKNIRGEGTYPAWFSRMTGAGLSDDTGAGGAGEKGGGMGTSQMDKYLMAAQFLPAAYNLGRGIFEKAWKPGSYETPANMKWQDLTGEAGRRGMLGAYAVAQRNARQLGGSNVLAGLQAGSTAYQRNLADYEEALENRNKMGRMQVDQFNKQIEQSNMQMRMNRDYLAQQAREKKAEMIGAGIGNIGQGAGQLWQNRQMMDALRIAYPNRTNANIPGLSDMDVNSYTGGGNRTTGGMGGFELDYSRPTFRQYKSWNK